jgi:3-deoxy-D-manno-octulosonate 8-phosphate phosphatase (KDO 8-P phosphatase)
MGAHHKIDPFDEYLDIYNINPQHVLYMGDDIPDIPPMRLAGIPCCPQNAVPEVKAMSKYISHKYGGDGCVRDVIEQVLKVRGHWAENFSAKND